VLNFFYKRYKVYNCWKESVEKTFPNAVKYVTVLVFLLLLCNDIIMYVYLSGIKKGKNYRLLNLFNNLQKMQTSKSFFMVKVVLDVSMKTEIRSSFNNFIRNILFRQIMTYFT
jgi:hypothetical protein